MITVLPWVYPACECKPARHLTTRSRIEEDLSERLCQNGLELWHDRLNFRGDHMAFEGGLVGPAFEGKKTPWLADHFHQRVDQATGFFGRLLGEGLLEKTTWFQSTEA